MSRSQPLLSICIPTFNRLHYLKESLDLLLPQAEALGVEVCVSDNCSSDGTVDYLVEKMNSYSCLKFESQREEITIDENMFAVISMATKEYLLLLGDDDILPVGSVTSILHEMDENMDLMILNGWHTDAELVQKKMHLPFNLQGKIIMSPSEAFASLWDRMPFGSFLASRDCFQPAYFERYLGTSHAYTGAVWDALAKKQRREGKCKVICMSEPTVLLRGGEKTWRKDTAKIMIYEIPKWFSLIGENNAYKDSAFSIRKLFLDQQTSIMSLLKFRAMGQLEYSDLELLSGELSDNQLENLNKVARFPKSLAKPMLYIYFKLKMFVKKLLHR